MTAYGAYGESGAKAGGADTGCTDPVTWLAALGGGADSDCTDTSAWWRPARRLSGG